MEVMLEHARMEETLIFPDIQRASFPVYLTTLCRIMEGRKDKRMAFRTTNEQAQLNYAEKKGQKSGSSEQLLSKHNW